MSDLLNSASLVMIPSGYKEDIVYSEVPTNGNGDLSFTRASNGTRVNSAGLVEDVPWNISPYSETFNDSYWQKVNGTITSDLIVAPNGTTTADLFTITNNAAFVEKTIVGTGTSFVFIPNTQYTLSCYFKKGSIDYNFRMLMYDGSTVTNSGIINLTTPSSSTVNYEDVGNGWYRFYHTFTSSASASSGYFYVVNYDYSTTITSGTNVYLWGAQVVQGSTAKPYFPTTDRLNVPRLTYQNGGGGCPSLLLEKQSTNLAIYSQQFNAGYTTYNGTTTDNFAIAPDGTQTAAKVETVSFNSATLRQTNGGLTNGQPYTLSLYIKQGSGITGFLDIGDTASTVNITPTNEWVRYTYTANWNTTLNFLDIELRGTNGSYCYIWGCQLEAGSYPTSYIPTTSSSATRVADECSKTGISSLIGQTEGVLFLDFDYIATTNTSDTTAIRLLGSGSAGMYLEINSNNTFEVAVVNSLGSLVFNSSSSAQTAGRYKFAIAYNANDYAFYLNGTQIAVDTSGAFASASLDSLNLGMYQSGSQLLDGSINQAAVFPTRLTNAELASLTTI